MNENAQRINPDDSIQVDNGRTDHIRMCLGV